jgi:hypothetical protein
MASPVPDGDDYDYPSKPNPPDHSDLLRYEKHVQDHVQKNRYMEEYDRRRQIEALEDMFNTPYILEARRFTNYDAYCRQSNHIFEEMDKWIVAERAAHPDWRTTGRHPLPYCFQGKTEMDGTTMRDHRLRKLEAVLADPNCPHLKVEYTQNILLPQLDMTVRFDPSDPSTHDPFMRTRGVAAPMVVGDRIAVTNKDGSVTYHRIPNAPMQPPYLGHFRTGRALGQGQWIARDNTFFTGVKTFTEQAALFKAELSCYERIRNIDEVMCDGKSFLLSRILDEALPEPNEEEAQLVLEQYEASNVFNPLYYFSDFITFQIELNVRQEKL